MSGADAPWLLRAIRIVAAKDSGAFRRAVFEEVSLYRPAVRVALAMHRFLGKGRLSSLFVAGYGLRAYVAIDPPRAGEPIWSIASYRNETRQFTWLAGLLPRDSIGPVHTEKNTLLRPRVWIEALAAGPHPRDLARALRIIHRYNQRHDFLVSCRVAATLGYYLRFRPMLARSRPRAVLVSTDSNPYGLGLAFAAKSLGLPAIYVTHGHIPDGPPRLYFDLSLLDGEAVVEVYRESGPIAGEVVYKGAEGSYRPMRTAGILSAGRTVGVFLSLIADWPRLGRVFAALQEKLAPQKIILRFHPNDLVRPRDAMRHIGHWPNLEVSYGESILLSDAEKCDLVIAGNSSCHLSLLKYGVPTVYVDGLDKVPRDFYRFLRHRIVPAFDRPEAIDLPAIAAFYEDPDWRRRFAFFDASYPGEMMNGDAVRAAIQRLSPELRR